MNRRIPIHMTKRARNLRKDPPHCEKIVWQLLRSRSVDGLKFRRQHAIDFFVVDFYCADAQLVIEIDGPTHEIEADMKRDAYLSNQGYKVLRFSNEQVIAERNAVLEAIWQAAHERLNSSSHPHPNPLPGRERESEATA